MPPQEHTNPQATTKMKPYTTRNSGLAAAIGTSPSSWRARRSAYGERAMLAVHTNSTRSGGMMRAVTCPPSDPPVRPSQPGNAASPARSRPPDARPARRPPRSPPAHRRRLPSDQRRSVAADRHLPHETPPTAQAEEARSGASRWHLKPRWQARTSWTPAPFGHRIPRTGRFCLVAANHLYCGVVARCPGTAETGNMDAERTELARPRIIRRPTSVDRTAHFPDPSTLASNRHST